MEILLNGQVCDLPADATVQTLIEHQGLGNRRLAVEINQILVPRSQFSNHRLAAGDRVEIIHAVGGG